MSKPNLPPLPPPPKHRGHAMFAGSQMIAYAEEAVRRALAEVAKAISTQADAQRVNYEQSGRNSYYEGMADGLDVAEQKVLAIIPDDSPGHKPTPVDTSHGHSAPVVGEATDAELDKLYRETITEGPEDDTQLWENPHRFYARAVLSRYAAPKASNQET